MTNKKNGSKSDWKNNYGRACWTADNSRYSSSNSHNSFKVAAVVIVDILVNVGFKLSQKHKCL